MVAKEEFRWNWGRRNFPPGDRWCPRWNQVVSYFNPNHVFLNQTNLDYTMEVQHTSVGPIQLFWCEILSLFSDPIRRLLPSSILSSKIMSLLASEEPGWWQQPNSRFQNGCPQSNTRNVTAVWNKWCHVRLCQPGRRLQVWKWNKSVCLPDLCSSLLVSASGIRFRGYISRR